MKFSSFKSEAVSNCAERTFYNDRQHMILFLWKTFWAGFYSQVTTTYIRYPKEIMEMERHFSGLQRWLQKYLIINNNSQSNFDFT